MKRRARKLPANNNRRPRAPRDYSDPVLPPRKRDWKPGAHQLGLFIRFPGGECIEVSAHDAKVSETEAALTLLRLLTRKVEERK